MTKITMDIDCGNDTCSSCILWSFEGAFEDPICSVFRKDVGDSKRLPECIQATKEYEELKHKLERANTLLNATFDILTKCNNSKQVLDVISESVFYDEAECDGNCLLEDIKEFLEKE